MHTYSSFSKRKSRDIYILVTARLSENLDSYKNSLEKSYTKQEHILNYDG
jgi:hypothetical protein